MKVTRLRLAAGALLCAVLAGALPVGAIPWLHSADEPSGRRLLAEGVTSISLPIVGRNYLNPAHRMSRFGVGVPAIDATAVSLSALGRLNAGWYLDWTARAAPSRPGGVTFAQLINLRDDGTSALSDASLAATVEANPGTLWLVGNEPDSPLQNNVTPEQYARAYHDLYRQIKAADPTAIVSAGGIVQPTPLRLKYLDLILQEYARLYGTQMPVDVWNIHIYILREEKTGWGAFYPPGVADEDGDALAIPYEIEDHIDIAIFRDMVVQFRQWMATNGYRECPLILTEFGVILPWDYFAPDLDDEEAKREAGYARVLAFMDASVDYLLTSTDPAIGCPYDSNRLVQRWAWFALVGSWGGWLYEPDTGEMSVFGQRYAELAATQPETINLMPVRLVAAAPAAQPGVETTLLATIVNNGEMPTTVPVVVRVYDGDPDGGGTQIGEARHAAPLDGGAGMAIVSVPWTPSEAKDYALYVRVDPLDSIHETDEDDNTLAASVSVTVTHPAMLPIVIASASS